MRGGGKQQLPGGRFASEAELGHTLCALLSRHAYAFPGGIHVASPCTATSFWPLRA